MNPLESGFAEIVLLSTKQHKHNEEIKYDKTFSWLGLLVFIVVVVALWILEFEDLIFVRFQLNRAKTAESPV